MKCEDVERLIPDYLDGKLDAVSKSEMEHHLSSCEKCLDEVKDIQHLFSLMSKSPVLQSAETLKINFYHMLHNEISKASAGGDIDEARGRKRVFRINRYGVAASIGLMIVGTFLGIMVGKGLKNSEANRQISQLRSEMSDIKKNTILTMLTQESSSGRIEALGYAEEIENPDQNLIGVLLKTLNNDKNVNVRIAAAYALEKFAGQGSVCDSLVTSLANQSDPVLQVTLINILAERKVKSALRPVQGIISNNRTRKEVRTVAKNSLHYFI